MEQSVNEAFSVLPLELRSIIYSLCWKKDLMNLALCNKWLRDDVSPLLWRNVRVKWATVYQFTAQQRTSNMSFISHLTFSLLGKNEYKSKEYISYGFAFFLQCCNHDKLTSIEFMHFIPSGALRLVGEILPSLRYLELDMVEADWADLPYLPVTLQSLIIRFGPAAANLTEDNWAVICKMEQLQFLGLTDCDSLWSDELSSVGEFKLGNLMKLNLLGTDVDDTLLTKIAATCTRLEDLQISDRSIYTDADGNMIVTDLGFSTIAEHKALKYLTLCECRWITNLNIAFLARLSSLEELYIKCCDAEELDASCLRSISEITSLKELFITEPCNIRPTDDDFAYIGNLMSLKTLVIHDFSHLTDASLDVIGTLKCLTKLDITNCSGFTDQGLVHLVAPSRLRELVCNYGDGGYDATMRITLAGLTMYGLPNFLVDEIVKSH